MYGCTGVLASYVVCVLLYGMFTECLTYCTRVPVQSLLLSLPAARRTVKVCFYTIASTMEDPNHFNKLSDSDDVNVNNRLVNELESDLNLPRKGRSLCLLVVADMDLPSASMLAEAALLELPKGGTLVDGILACGPFVTPESLSPYLQQQQQQHHDDDGDDESPTGTNLSPELTFALEGLVTGCLSQLESISCRVAWVPSIDRDPSSLWSHQQQHYHHKKDNNTVFANGHSSLRRSLNEPFDDHKGEKRLTPNSRNIDRQSLPLAPGLSCCGLAIGPVQTHVTQCDSSLFSNAIPSAEEDYANLEDEYVLGSMLFLTTLCVFVISFDDLVPNVGCSAHVILIKQLVP